MSQFQPMRLKEACMDRRIRIGELAERTGISKTTISNLSNGKIRAPQKETITKISWELKRPEKYFYTPISRNFMDTTEPTYRSFSSRANLDNLSIRAKLNIAEDIIQYLYEFIEGRYMDIPSNLLVDCNTTFTNSDLIESLALKLREYWNIGNSVIDNMTILLENHGILCFKLDLPRNIESVNICTRLDDSEHEIAIIVTSVKMTYFRQRFTLAHELGHIVLHHFLDEEDYIKNSKLIEEQANRFASAFLMPNTVFPESVYRKNLAELLSLKKQWGVSMSACARRMSDLYLISMNQYQNMNIEISRNGWKKNEPLDNDVYPENPYYIEAGYRFLFDKKMITAANIVDKFNMYPIELTNYIGNAEWLSPARPDLEYSLKGSR